MCNFRFLITARPLAKKKVNCFLMYMNLLALWWHYKPKHIAGKIPVIDEIYKSRHLCQIHYYELCINCIFNIQQSYFEHIWRWFVLLTQYCAGDKIENEMGWACGMYAWGEGYRVLVGKPEGRRPLGRPRRRWVDNIRMDLQEMGCGYMDWIGLAQDRDRWRTVVSAVMNLRVPWNAGNFLTSCKPVSFSRRTLHHGVSK